MKKEGKVKEALD